MSSLTKSIVVIIDELLFRPLVWLINWTPDRNKNARYWNDWVNDLFEGKTDED